ncbi:MAG: alpha/beta fold hydrolase [Lachnospiraceae bacterium]|nr:alpha/beta fold hydrolase [Lachnospiraceae bacterium]
MDRKEINLDTSRDYHIACLDGSSVGQTAIILCLHGFTGSKHSPTIEKLHGVMKNKRIGTFAFDWPGHGRSDAPFSALTVENCMQDMDTVYKYIHEKYGVPIWCFATSLGGYLAMNYHLRHPEAFEKLLLRSPALKMAEVMKAAMSEDRFARLMKGEKVDFGHDQPLLLTKDYYDDLCAHDIFDEAPPYPEKILIIHGDKDETVPIHYSEDYAGKNGIALHILKDAGHEYDNPGDQEWIMKEALEFFPCAR